MNDIEIYLVNIVGRKPGLLVARKDLQGDVAARVALALGLIAQDVDVYKVASVAEDEWGVGLGIQKVLSLGGFKLPTCTQIRPEVIYALAEES